MNAILALLTAATKQLAVAQTKIKTLEQELSGLKATNLKEKLLHRKRVTKLQENLKMVLARAKNAKGENEPSPKPTAVDAAKHKQLQAELEVGLLVLAR